MMEEPSDEALDLLDEAPDFRMLRALGGASKNDQTTLPRRGEKDFEPDGTHVQHSTLLESREAMNDALLYERKHSSKTHVVAIWDFAKRMARVEYAKGPLFQTMGKADNHATIWLLPEETIYLVERGNIQCYDTNNLPMTLQATYNVCLQALGGLHFYQTYAYLKRCGFAVLRSKGTSIEQKYKKRPSFLISALSSTRRIIASMTVALFGSKLCGFSSLLPQGQYNSYLTVFKRLQLACTNDYDDCDGSISGMNMQFNVYKPRPLFKKSMPGPPDYQVFVVSSKTTKLPNFSDITPFGLATAPSNDNRQKNINIDLRTLKTGHTSLILAIVDNGIISFVKTAMMEFERFLPLKTQPVKRWNPRTPRISQYLSTDKQTANLENGL